MQIEHIMNDINSYLKENRSQQEDFVEAHFDDIEFDYEGIV